MGGLLEAVYLPTPAGMMVKGGAGAVFNSKEE